MLLLFFVLFSIANTLSLVGNKTIHISFIFLDCIFDLTDLFLYTNHLHFLNNIRYFMCLATVFAFEACYLLGLVE